MGIAHAAGESCLRRRILRLIPRAGGSTSGLSVEAFCSRGPEEVIEHVAPITCFCGEVGIVGLRKIIGVSQVFHVISESRIINAAARDIIKAAAGDIGTIRSLISGGLARKPSLREIFLPSEPPQHVLVF